MKSNILIREAIDSDNEEILNLTSITPMKAEISIRIDRSPDFFRLLDIRGDSFVLVAEMMNKIIGTFSASTVDVYINGKPEKVCYLGDFKIDPHYHRSTTAARLAKAMLHKLVSKNADLLFFTAAYGNDSVIPFSKGRANLPTFTEVGIFKVFEIIPTLFKSRNTKYIIEEKPFIVSSLNFFDNFIKKYQLGPVYSESSFENSTLITATLKDKTVSAIAITDIGKAKQNVIIKLPFYLDILIKVFRIINSLLPLVSLPELNEPVRMIYIKSFAYEPGYQDALHLLLKRARKIAFDKKYSFLVIGIHEKDPDIRLFSAYPKFTFKSLGFVTSLKNRQNILNYILSGIPFEDYSLV